MSRASRLSRLEHWPSFCQGQRLQIHNVNEHRAGPVGAGGHRLEGLRQEGVARANVGMGMIVVSRAVVGDRVARVDK
jgi:hypothetical protein